MHIFEKDTKNLSNSDAEMLEATILEDINDIENNVFTNKLYKYYGFLQNIHTSFLDYVSNYSIIVCSKSQFEKSKEILFSEARDFLLELQEKRKTISHLEYFNERAEIFIKNARESFDFVTSRAVSRLNILLELSIPFLKVGGKLIAYKGINYQEEINESKNALDLLYSKIIAIEEENLVQINEKRYNIFIQKNQKTSQKYPREYRLIKKKAL